jgi:hypothetical protein
MPSEASKLFHTIVVVGASMGCGSSSTVGSQASAADASPTDASTGATDVVSRADAGPQSYCDCTRPGTFRCGGCASGTTPEHGRCPDNDGVDCTCDESVAIAAPSDCAHPEQFVCAILPDVDASLSADDSDYGFGPDSWYAFADCSCDTTRPIMASQCTDERTILTCAVGYGCPSPVDDAGGFGAAPSDTVRYACACLPPPVTIA